MPAQSTKTWNGLESKYIGKKNIYVYIIHLQNERKEIDFPVNMRFQNVKPYMVYG